MLKYVKSYIDSHLNQGKYYWSKKKFCTTIKHSWNFSRIVDNYYGENSISNNDDFELHQERKLNLCFA